MPTPTDLSLPKKFQSWRRIDSRRTQEDILIQVACSDKRFILLNAPTGIGKSTIYMGVASLLAARTMVLTQTKGLQAQVHGEFSPMGMKEIKGQNNYACEYFAETGRRRLPGCDEGPCHAGIECVLKDGGCHYYDAVRAAVRSRLIATNYSYWMTMQRFAEPGTLGKFDALILDEAHDAAQALADFVRIEVHGRDVRKLLDLDIPRGATIDEWVDWVDREAIPRCRERIESARTSVSLYSSAIAVVRGLREIEGNLRALSQAGSWKRVDAPDPPAWVPGTSTDWIIEESRGVTHFQPVWASGYAEDFLFARIPKVILVSATVTPRDARYLGIPESDFEFLEYPSPFKAENRPVYVFPTARVSRNMSKGETRVWMNRIDQIIEHEAVDKEGKGIVHTVSYERARLIFTQSRWRSILQIHDKRSMRDTVSAFKAAQAPAVLISPSVSTGWDFPMEEATFQIVAKVPFIDSRPAVIRARAKSDRNYLDYVALVTLIQMCGRGVRSSTDRCSTFIIDDHFWAWFYPRNRKLFPKWFKVALKRIRSIDEANSRKGGGRG